MIALIYSSKGLLNDNYYFPLRKVSFEEAIHEYLKTKFNRKKIYFCDINGLYFYEKYEENNNEPKLKLSTLIPSNEEHQNEKKKSKLRIPLVETEIIPKLKEIILNEKNVAFIFNDIFSILNNFNNVEKRELNNIILEIKRFNEDNILFFIEPSGANILEIKEKLKNSGLENLTMEFFYDLENLKPKNTFDVNEIYEDEIRNLVNYLRLKFDIQFDFNNFNDLINELVKKVKQENLTLKELEILLKNNKKEILLKEEKSGWEKLEELVGFEEVKEELKKFIKYLKNVKKFENNEKKQNLNNKNFLNRIDKAFFKEKQEKNNKINLNFILTGNPGTGKTTLAKIIGEILKEENILEYGQFIQVSRSDLVAGYVGQTALKTKEVIEKANGGVLFIDEAYALSQGGENDFGQEAIDELVAALPSPNFSCIIAGYEKEIEKFLEANEGLERRFIHKIHLKDYNGQQLKEIFLREVKKENIELDNELNSILDEFFENAYKSGYTKNKNASFSINLFNEMNQNKYFNGTNKLTIEHIPKKYEKFLPPKYQNFEIPKEFIDEFNHLVGRKQIKNELKNLINQIKYAKLTNTKINLNHYCFVGNPGTGKTTVAMLFGKILNKLNILEDKFIEVKPSDLVAGYVGQTYEKTNKILNKALGGVLFIDEAYGLVDTNEFGKNVIETLVKFMEDNRNEIVIIFAGYKKEMERLLNLNSGLDSRLKIIEFEDYTIDELLEIFKEFVFQNNLNIEQNALDKLEILIKNNYDKAKNGNARYVRNLFETIKNNMINRVIETNDKNLTLVTEKDIFI